jgi:hypothetical protein
VEWTISVLREISDDYEVVIVDDGSTYDNDRSSHARFADRRESMGISMRRLSPVALSNE